MKRLGTLIKKDANRRSFLKGGMVAAGAATVGAGLLKGGLSAFGRDRGDELTEGDVAILRLLAAAELIEADLGNNILSSEEPKTAKSQASTGAIRCTWPLSRFLTATCHSMSTTILMMS
jgi:hypothetical protein